jgi:hypothetical protein
MRAAVLACAVLAAGPAVFAQTPPPAAEPAASAERGPSAELVGLLSQEVGITGKQAEGAAGSLFGLAKTRMKAEEFGKVAAAVPDMDVLLEAAPAADAASSALGGLSGGMGSVAGLASTAGAFKKLGLGPEVAARCVPVLTKFVSQKGGAEVASLLGSALK